MTVAHFIVNVYSSVTLAFYNLSCLKLRDGTITEYVHVETQKDPDVLYFLPHLKSSRDYKVSISDNDIALAVHLCCKERPTFGCSNEFVELASILMDENDLVMPSNADEAEMLYLDLLSAISRI